MPKKRGVKKRAVRKASVKRGMKPTTKLYVGIFVFVLAIILIGVGNPTGKAIDTSGPYFTVSNGNLNVHVNGRNVDSVRYYNSYCDGMSCKVDDESCDDSICFGILSGAPYDPDLFENPADATSVAIEPVPEGTPAPEPRTSVFGSKNGFFNDMAYGWENGKLDEGVAKYFLFFMLIVLISTILGFADFPSNGLLRFLFSVLISFLSIAYVTPGEVFGVMQTYSAFGLALIAIIPFMILVFFSAQIVAKKRKNMVGALILDRFLWWAFSLFLLYKLFYIFFSDTAPEGSFVPLLIVVVAFAFSLLFAIKNEMFMNGCWKVVKQAFKIKTKQRDLQNAEKKIDTIEDLAGLNDSPLPGWGT